MPKTERKVINQVRDAEQKMKSRIKTQIKSYQEKIKVLRQKLGVTGTSEGVVESLNKTVMEGGKRLKEVLLKGEKSKQDRK